MIDKDYKTYITGFENSNMAELINEYSGQNLVGFLPQAKSISFFKGLIIFLSFFRNLIYHHKQSLL